jgi:predicted GNAT family acetyltransferase
MASRLDTPPAGCRIGAVFTPPERRRRGYASALVAAVSRRSLEEGRSWCSLYADLANPTSNSIYQAIGYQPLHDVVRAAFVYE